MIKKYRLKLNSVSSLEELLQETVDDLYRMLQEIQNNMNNLQSSTKLADEPMAAKASYSKAIHDFITDKEKIIRLKADISKIMLEVIKTKGNETEALNNIKKGDIKNENVFDVRELTKVAEKIKMDFNKDTAEYKISKTHG